MIPISRISYTCFAQAVGLRGWDGASWQNEAEWLESYADQVNDAAAMYVFANTEGIAKYPAIAGISMNKNAYFIMQAFLDAIRTQAMQEPSS